MLAYCHAVVLRIQLSFFSSSRRRHTRWPRDWSSDVCSSDLDDHLGRQELLAGDRFQGPSDGLLFVVKRNDDRNIGVDAKIGRASCRERVGGGVGGVGGEGKGGRWDGEGIGHRQHNGTWRLVL